MKFIALFSLSTGLAAAIAAIVLKARAIGKAGKPQKNDGITLAMLSIFAVVMAVNIVFAALYF